MSSVKEACSLIFFCGCDCRCKKRGDESGCHLKSGENWATESSISSSGLEQLSPKDGNDSKLSLDDTEESEKPDDDVGLLELSLLV